MIVLKNEDRLTKCANRLTGERRVFRGGQWNNRQIIGVKIIGDRPRFYHNKWGQMKLIIKWDVGIMILGGRVKTISLK